MVCQQGWLLKIDFLIHIALWLNDLILIHETQRSIFKAKPFPVDAALKWTLDKSDYIFHHRVNLWRLTTTLTSKCLYPNSRGIKNYDEGLYCVIYWRAAFFPLCCLFVPEFHIFQGAFWCTQWTLKSTSFCTAKHVGANRDFVAHSGATCKLRSLHLNGNKAVSNRFPFFT